MKTFTPGEILTAEDLNAQFTELSRVTTATLPVYDGAWRHDGDGGLVRSANGAHYLNISLVRTGSSFHMNAGQMIDIMRTNNLVTVPSTREWVICGTLFGPDMWPMPVLINNGVVRVFCPGPVDIKQNGSYRGFASWVA